MTDQANVAVIQGIYDKFSRGDIPGILNQLDPRAELVYEGPAAIPWTGNRRGRDEWAQFFQAVGENVDEVKVTMEPFAAQGDNVVAAGRYQARVKATGKRIDSPLVHLWTVRNGLVVKCQEFTNTAAEVAALAAATVGTHA